MKLKNLNEALKYSILGQSKPSISNPSSSGKTPNMDISLTDMESLGNHFQLVDDSTYSEKQSSFFGEEDSEYSKLLRSQNELIEEYRRLSKIPEVSKAINEITNEALFDTSSNTIFSLDFDEGVSSNIKEMLIKEMNKVEGLLNLKYNIEAMFRRYYIDGVIALSLVYDNDNITKGIQSISMMSPFGLTYNPKTDSWVYDLQSTQEADSSNFGGFGMGNTYEALNTEEYSQSELVYVDSGIYEKGITLSHLHPIMKTANQLSSLEDMLLPMRFSRSISRRVFNIDVGRLPFSKSMQAIKKIKDNFKYKKSYDINRGTISHSSTTASLVEDYYLPKRAGGEGSSIDVLEETGNLGEVGDIEYFKTKLYQSLNVPINRMLGGSDSTGMFDFTGTQIEFEEKRFFQFLYKVKMRFGLLFIEILKRQVISKQLMHEFEFDHYAKKIDIRWEKENHFFERERLELFTQKVELYNETSSLVGELFGKTWLLKKIIRFTDEEIMEMNESLESDRQDDLNKDLEDSQTLPDDIFNDEETGEEDMEDEEGNEEDVETSDVEDDTNTSDKDAPERPARIDL